MEYKHANTLNELIKKAHCEKIIEYLYVYIQEHRPPSHDIDFDKFDKAQANLLKLQKYLHGEIDLEEWELSRLIDNIKFVGFQGLAWRGYVADLESLLQGDNRYFEQEE